MSLLALSTSFSSLRTICQYLALSLNKLLTVKSYVNDDKWHLLKSSATLTQLLRLRSSDFHLIPITFTVVFRDKKPRYCLPQGVQSCATRDSTSISGLIGCLSLRWCKLYNFIANYSVQYCSKIELHVSREGTHLFRAIDALTLK